MTDRVPCDTADLCVLNPGRLTGGWGGRRAGRGRRRLPRGGAGPLRLVTRLREEGALQTPWKTRETPREVRADTRTRSQRERHPTERGGSETRSYR